jgi:hypothetical protein
MKNDLDRRTGWRFPGPGRKTEGDTLFAKKYNIPRKRVVRHGGHEKLEQLRINQPEIFGMILSGVL